MMQVCAICDQATPGTYYLPMVLKDMRLQCDALHTSITLRPGVSNYAHPKCITDLKKRLADAQSRQGTRASQFHFTWRRNR